PSGVTARWLYWTRGQEPVKAPASRPARPEVQVLLATSATRTPPTEAVIVEPDIDRLRRCHRLRIGALARRPEARVWGRVGPDAQPESAAVGSGLTLRVQLQVPVALRLNR